MSDVYDLQIYGMKHIWLGKRMKDPVQISWEYSPTNFFEEEISVDLGSYTFTINNGLVTIHLDSTLFEEHGESVLGSINRKIETYFTGAQIFNQRKYQLNYRAYVQHHPDGRKDMTIVAEPCVCHASISADIVIGDAQGKVIFDSKQERLRQQRKFAELSLKFNSDNIVQSLLSSYSSSVNDPSNELIYLYEIRESLLSFFGKPNILRKYLNITKRDWDRFGYLTNNAPLYEGRHRGKNPGSLRKATSSELDETRSFSRVLILSYLNYLDLNLTE